jgi:hypothetical protein
MVGLLVLHIGEDFVVGQQAAVYLDFVESASDRIRGDPVQRRKAVVEYPDLDKSAPGVIRQGAGGVGPKNPIYEKLLRGCGPVEPIGQMVPSVRFHSDTAARGCRSKISRPLNWIS